jgi:hypothetical protein
LSGIELYIYIYIYIRTGAKLLLVITTSVLGDRQKRFWSSPKLSLALVKLLVAIETSASGDHQKLIWSAEAQFGDRQKQFGDRRNRFWRSPNVHLVIANSHTVTDSVW